MTYFFWILWIWEWLQSSGKNSELRFCRPGFWPQLCYQPTVWHKVDLITPHSSFLTYKMKNLGQRQLRHLPVSKFYDLMKKYFVGLKHESPLNSNSFFFSLNNNNKKSKGTVTQAPKENEMKSSMCRRFELYEHLFYMNSVYDPWRKKKNYNLNGAGNFTNPFIHKYLWYKDLKGHWAQCTSFFMYLLKYDHLATLNGIPVFDDMLILQYGHQTQTSHFYWLIANERAGDKTVSFG